MLIHRPFKRQPQGPVRLNRDHPLARDLLDICIARPFGLYSPLTGNVSTSPGSTPGAYLHGRMGVARWYDASSSSQYDDLPGANWTSPSNSVDGFTLYAMGRIGSKNSTTASNFATTRKVLSFYTDPANNRGLAIGTDTNEQLYATATLQTFRTSGAVAVEYDKVFQAFAIAEAAGLYVDVIDVGESTKSATYTAGAGSGNASLFRAGIESSVASPGDKAVFYGAVWSRVLTKSERQALAADPYQLLEPVRIWVPKTGGSAAAVGLADETDAALGLSAVQRTSAGRADETDASLAQAPVQVRAAGLAEETDAALALSAGAASAVGLASETDAAIALAAVQLLGTGRADEADSALALSLVLARDTGRSDETDDALALTPLQVAATGLAAETDAALALSAGSASSVGLAAETDSALALSALQVLGTGRADETDSALALTLALVGATGRADETDAALGLQPRQIAATGRADELDTALALSAGAATAVGMAEETDTAFALPIVQVGSVGLALEIDAAFAREAVQAAVAGVAVEVDTALQLFSVDFEPMERIDRVSRIALRIERTSRILVRVDRESAINRGTP